MELKDIVGTAIGLILIATIIPVGLTIIADAEADLETAGVNAAVITMIVVVAPIMAIVGIIASLIPKFRN